jgi:hypothetical protein
MRKKDHPMRKKDQEIFRRAVELAGSGKCKDWYDVLERLVEKGYRRAPDLLDGEKIRTILDFQCGKGRSQDNGALSRR